jgi:ABC-type nitrate/sulfonate/bicarbonate transport system substrate-binding protein
LAADRRLGGRRRWFGENQTDSRIYSAYRLRAVGGGGEKGYFKKYGLDVALSKEASWANIRDKVAIGELDGAHMLAGMPIAASLGVGALPKATITAFSLDLNGNAITVSNDLYERMVKADPEAMKERPLTARALKKVIDADKAAGKEPMTFAMVFPVSTHNYQLRYWLGAAGINPDQDYG